METPFSIPEDINAEVLLAYLPEKNSRLKLGGLHHRNVTHDVLSFEKEDDGAYAFTLGRSSLYEVLPEMMFHPVDRFAGIVGDEQEKAFKEELAKQEEEISQARRFFAPFDILLLKLRTDVRELVRRKTEGNQVLIDILCDSIPDTWRKNRFVKRTLMFVPYAKRIRGDNALLSLMLRKVFFCEGLSMKVQTECLTLEDQAPRYQHCLDGELGEGFAGNRYEEVVPVLKVHCWLEGECGAGFNAFLEELETLRHFVQDYFIAMEQRLVFDLSTDVQCVRLSDDEDYHYLGYNANLKA